MAAERSRAAHPILVIQAGPQNVPLGAYGFYSLYRPLYRLSSSELKKNCLLGCKIDGLVYVIELLLWVANKLKKN